MGSAFAGAGLLQEKSRYVFLKKKYTMLKLDWKKAGVCFSGLVFFSFFLSWPFF